MVREIYNPGAAAFVGSILFFGVPILIAVAFQQMMKPFFPKARWVIEGPHKLAERVGIVLLYIYLGVMGIFVIGGTIIGLGIAAWDYVTSVTR